MAAHAPSIGLVLAGLLLSCNASPPQPPPLPASSGTASGTATATSSGSSAGATASASGTAGDVSKGMVAYQANCTACHNSDPSQPGTLGPELKGSSRELILDRVTKAEYPAGYTPKRATHLMQPLPQLAGSVDDLTAYLNQ